MTAGLLHQSAIRRAAERQLRDREALNRIVVDGAIDAILTVDAPGVVVSFNPAAERIFGWPAAEIIGQRIELLFPPEPRSNEPAGGNRGQPGAPGDPVREGERELVARRRDGTGFPMHLRCSRPQVPGSGVVTAMGRDLTEYRQASEALQGANARLQTKVIELEQQTRAIALLGRMSDVLQVAVSPADAYASIADYAQQLLPLDGGALCLVDAERSVVEVVTTWGAEVCRSHFAPVDCRALRSARFPVADADPATTIRPYASGDASLASACVPITSAGKALGVVCFRWHEPLPQASDDATSNASFRANLAAAFARQVGLALTNLRLKELLRAQATHDPLTGLHNRRSLEDFFRREVLRAQRRGSPIGVLMLDLDHFKAFNDAHGHAAGDTLLQAFAIRLRASVRTEDIACRYGGEEFAVIMPDATQAHAQVRAEQIRGGMHDVAIEFHGSSLAGVTVSIGVAAFPEDGASPDALLRAADAALYAAKADGRDRTACCIRRRASAIHPTPAG